MNKNVLMLQILNDFNVYLDNLTFFFFEQQLSTNLCAALLNGWQLAKMKKSIPDMSLPWKL